MSRKIVIPGVSFAGPKLVNDPIETNGSLLLIEPAHPVVAWPAGVPVSGATRPNVLAATANPVVGGATDVTYSNAGLTATKGLMERTAKGALHGIVSQTVLATGNVAKLVLPPALLAYLLANPTHTYYYSAWERQTRIGGTAPQPARLFVGAGAQHEVETSVHTYWYKTGLRPSAGWPTEFVAKSTLEAATALGAGLRAIATKGFRNSVPANVAAMVDNGWLWGRRDGSYLTSAPSYALYRCYVEDLTVSGRAFSVVLAADQALYDAAFGPGGRYYGDTYTDPTTLA